MRVVVLCNTRCPYFFHHYLMFLSIGRLTSVPVAILSGALLFVGKAAALQGPPTNLPGSGSSDLTTLIMKIVDPFLNIIGLLAAIVIIIAGIRLIFSLGDEEGKETAKKAVLYAVVGLLLVLFAKGIVLFVIGLGN